ncbi:hypothetical protein [Cryobacterium sp. PH31-L1]|uniref:hypothetical protein n=1 Tax=Cryobacterium sp. PH31-L1 TaxID=3046199 RepID=UPI0024BADF1C|nr:hypothetical protein [Cryobacterium sp. PH31-L1]MDJ0377163.1 hypothetical protein [Cryobacterium sp. PH31-L1]
MAVASVFVAAGGYAILVVAARALGPEQYLSFSVFWSGLYLAVGAIFGVQQETTRSVKTVMLTASEPRGGGTRALYPGMIVGFLVAAGVAISSFSWAPSVFGQQSALFVAMIAAGTVLYAGHATLAGVLAGFGSWNSYSGLLIAEAAVRLFLICIVAFLALSVAGLAAAGTLGMVTWVIFLLRARFRAAALTRLDEHLWQSVAHSLQAVLASGASAVIVTGFPLVLAAIALNEDATELAIIILIVTLTRAPVMLPLNAFMGMIVASFVDSRAHGLSVVFRAMGAVLGFAAILGALATVIGPPLLVFFFGHAYKAGGPFIGGATVAAGLIGVISISGAALLARGRHLIYTVGWLVAALTTCAVLFLPLPLPERVLVSLVVGPVIGTILHIRALAGPSMMRGRRS